LSLALWQGDFYDEILFILIQVSMLFVVIDIDGKLLFES